MASPIPHDMIYAVAYVLPLIATSDGAAYKEELIFITTSGTGPICFSRLAH